jgi:hypothetical protein
MNPDTLRLERQSYFLYQLPIEVMVGHLSFLAIASFEIRQRLPAMKNRFNQHWMIDRNV